MAFELNFYQVLMVAVAVIGGSWALCKVLLTQTARHMDERFELITKRFDTIEQANREEANHWQRIEREMMEMKAQLPLHYVRREDFIRGQSIIENKIDSLALKLENAQLRGSGGTHGK
jgi:hypothetical protein